MMRAKLLLTIGGVVTLLGMTIAGVAWIWLATEWGDGPHIYDPDGPLYRQVSMARFGAFVGILTLAIGLVLVAVGFIRLRKVS